MIVTLLVSQLVVPRVFTRESTCPASAAVAVATVSIVIMARYGR